MKRFLLILSMVAIFWPMQAQAYIDDYDALLRDYVKPTKRGGITFNGVDYDSWTTDLRHSRAMDSLEKTQLSTLRTKKERLAFWINAYNLLTIDLIVGQGERDSIKNLGFLFRSPWVRYNWKIDGKLYTLDEIEHDIIRKIGEPRIHFAVNCAAISCPDLRNEAYRADSLDSQLRDQQERIFDNKTKGLRKDGNTIYATKVMDWYEEDFSKGNPLKYLRKHAPSRVGEADDLRFFRYDWSLNKL